MIPETLEELTEWVLKENDTYGALALHPFVSEEWRKKLEMLMFEDKRSRLVFASAHYTPDSVLDRLARGNIEGEDIDEQLQAQVWTRVVKHPNAAAETIEWIYQRGQEYEQGSSEKNSADLSSILAAHRHTPTEILEDLDWQGSEKIRMALCGNTNTPLGLIKKILPLCGKQEKKRLVKHPELDNTVLETLWDEGDEFLQAEVAAHSNIPEKLLDEAINSAHIIIRKRLASNVSIGESIRYRLLQDEEAQVRTAVVKNQEATTDDGFTDEQLLALCDDPSEQVRRSEAKRSELSQEVIQQLAEDDDAWVRRWLARNPETSEQILERLAGDEDEHVRRSVARNSGCPEKLLARLAKDESSWVRAGVAMRADVPMDCLMELAKEEDTDVLSAIGKNPLTPVEILNEITENVNRDIRRSVILNSKVTADTLARLEEDPYPLNRIILGSKKQSSLETKWALANDPDPEVRFSAIRTYAREIPKCVV